MQLPLQQHPRSTPSDIVFGLQIGAAVQQQPYHASEASGGSYQQCSRPALRPGQRTATTGLPLDMMKQTQHAPANCPYPPRRKSHSSRQKPCSNGGVIGARGERLAHDSTPAPAPLKAMRQCRRTLCLASTSAPASSSC